MNQDTSVPAEVVGLPEKVEPKSWRCFHCDDVFTSEREARTHFGPDEGATPACRIKGAEGGLVEALRKAQADAHEAWMSAHDESGEMARAYSAHMSRHSSALRDAEQVGYDRGLADAVAHPETLGLRSNDGRRLEEADSLARDGEIAALLSNLRWMEKISEETLEGEEEKIVRNIESNLASRRAARAGVGR